MNTQTSLVAEQFRLQQWANQIKDCQNRPSDMKVDAWCREHDLTKANYYYCLGRIRSTFTQCVCDQKGIKAWKALEYANENRCIF